MANTAAVERLFGQAVKYEDDAKRYESWNNPTEAKKFRGMAAKCLERAAQLDQERRMSAV